MATLNTETGAPPSQNVLFFGATGTIGVPIFNVVLKNKRSFKRLVIYTSSGGGDKKQRQLQDWKAQGVEVIEGDVQDEKAVLKAYEAIDTVVSALGRTAIALQIGLIQLADRTPNVRRFIPSEFGTDIAHSPSSSSERPHQQKLKMRAALAETKDLDYTYLVTGPYSDTYLTKKSGGQKSPEAGNWDVSGRKATIVGTGQEKIAFSSVGDVGLFVVRALTRPSPKTHNAALKVKSFLTTNNEILQEFERQTNAKWDVTYVSLDRLRQVEKELWEKDDPYKTGATLRRIWTEGGTLYEKWDNDVLGLGQDDTESVADAVKDAIEAQKN